MSSCLIAVLLLNGQAQMVYALSLTHRFLSVIYLVEVQYCDTTIGDLGKKISGRGTGWGPMLQQDPDIL
jgi:hypothetical protein